MYLSNLSLRTVDFGTFAGAFVPVLELSDQGGIELRPERLIKLLTVLAQTHKVKAPVIWLTGAVQDSVNLDAEEAWLTLRKAGVGIVCECPSWALPAWRPYCTFIVADITEADWLCYEAGEIRYSLTLPVDPIIKPYHAGSTLVVVPKDGSDPEKVLEFLKLSAFSWRVGYPQRPRIVVDCKDWLTKEV